jgi:uncharacterized protein (DUF885 family)
MRSMLLSAALLVLAACGAEEQGVATPGERQLPWADFVATTIDEYYRRNPEQAVYAGLHQYDGMASDWSLDAAREYSAWLAATIDAAESYADLQGLDAFERDYLVTALRSDAFWIDHTNYLTKNPLTYISDIGTGVYVDREYAPLEDRLRAYTRYVENVPRMLEQMRDNLEPPLPAPFVTMGQRILNGLAEYLADTVPQQFAAVENDALQRQFTAANGAAAEAVKQSADWLGGLQATATQDYALGEELFLRMLSETQGIDVTLEELRAAGQADLDRNLETLYQACAKFAPGESTEDCVLKVQERKPPEGAVGGATRQLPDLKAFIVGNDIVSIPGTEDALVAEAPPHRRFNFAYIEIPGPFEKGLPSVYRIAPPDPSWSEEDQLAYIAGETDLLATSIHEVWPGHFLQYLHKNRTENRVGRHFSTYSFGEGWAHYTEEMMLDAGYGDGDPEIRIGQLLNALLRNVRYLSAVGLHTGDMTVEESQAMFEEKAFQDFGNASQQAYRGTYDPGYLNYTLGKLIINKLREDWTDGRGGREAWGAFHDQFLSYGSPPIPLVRKQMLGDDYEGDTALLPH